MILLLTYVERSQPSSPVSSSCHAVHSRSALLFIAGPLRTTPTRLPHPTSRLIPLLLFNWQPAGEERKGVGNELRRGGGGEGVWGAHLFSFGKKLPASPAVRLLCSSSWLLRRSFCSCQCGGVTPLPRGRERSGEGSRARGAVPEALFKRVHVRRDNFDCDTVALCVSADPWQRLTVTDPKKTLEKSSSIRRKRNFVSTNIMF